MSSSQFKDQMKLLAQATTFRPRTRKECISMLSKLTEGDDEPFSYKIFNNYGPPTKNEIITSFLDQEQRDAYCSVYQQCKPLF
jgi:hypothetical protein